MPHLDLVLNFCPEDVGNGSDLHVLPSMESLLRCFAETLLVLASEG